jgi:hypothetical protein
MPQGWFLRAVLAIALGLGVTAGLIRADEALPLPNPVPPSAPVIDHSVPLGESFHHSQDVVLPEWPAVGQGPGYPSSFRERLHNCVTKYVAANVPAFCWAHHNSVGCGNFCSEFNFIFGSCRTFYGETCFRGPPPQPVPVGYWYGAGYPYGPGEHGGCRCP